MIIELQHYPAYKDSGVEWLGRVPEHWEVLKLKLISKRAQNGSTPPTEVAAYYNEVGFPWYGPPSLGSSLTIGKPIRYVTPAAIEAGVVRPITPPALAVSVIGNVGRSALLLQPGATNQQITCFELNVALCNPFFIAYQFRLAENFLTTIASSTTIAILDSSELKNTPIPRPPLPEQTAIVRFLDYVDRRIQRYTRAKQKLIKLLEEYKQALIHQAVTGQIDVRTGKPYPTYKDSGVEWFGQVPEHWEVRRVKRIARLNPSKSETPAELRDGRAVFLPMEQVGTDGRFDVSEMRPISELWNGFTYFRRDDVIVAKITPCFENGKGACLENLPTALGFGSTEFHVIRPSKEIVSAYLYRITMLSEFRRLGTDEMTGAAGQQRVPVEFIANFPVPLPPLPEQNAIVAYLDAQTAKLDAAIAATRREIELLREYRERLIADVVTGKADVRAVAAQLPEEQAEEEEAIDEPTGETDDTVESFEESADEAVEE